MAVRQVKPQFEIKEDGTIVITIPGALKAEGAPSSSGKTMVLSTTNGNTNIGETADGSPVFCGLNIYKK
jgi:hypothetical protein